MSLPHPAPSGSDVVLSRLLGLHPKLIDLTLGRVERLLAALGHPQRALPPVIHIAGTNGKGSTLACLRAGLEAEGARVHAYTSPHLVRFHERIRLAGGLIAEPALADLLAECEAANGGAPITFFEITTCAAFLAYARTPADWLLLEVGLGGRLDATNVVDRPALCVITPVSYDHEQYLGGTLAAIAGEKAGILKPGVPCVVGPQAAEALEVIEARAEAVGAPLLIHGRDWLAWEERGRLVVQDGNGLADLPPPVLRGAHQIANAGAAVVALRALGRSDTAQEAAPARAEWPARLQRLRQGPLAAMAAGAGAAGAPPPRTAAGPTPADAPETTGPAAAELWLDGGHNPAAGAALAAALQAMPPRPTHLICGMLNTKDVGGFLRPLAGVATSLRAVSIPGAAATLPASETRDAARAAGLRAETAADVTAALAAILAEAPTARVLVCGSLYLAGEVLRENG